MSNINNYKKYFTKDYLMRPNSFRLLDELIEKCPKDASFDRTLDLGCGYALTSMFIANETAARNVYAFDLWIPASERKHYEPLKRVKEEPVKVIEETPEEIPQRAEPGKSFEEMSIEELQAEILARLSANGPLTDRMKREVRENIYRDSLLNWVKSFR